MTDQGNKSPNVRASFGTPTRLSGSQSSQKKNPPRLMISKLVLENFKSYAGRQEVGPFHHCFSAVVGPNGSGKSNVIDAILFVFGKQARQLRLKKVSELIHKSEQFPNLECAKVEVHFQEIIAKIDNPNEYEVVPDSDFVVSRTANSNDKSDYFIDGRKVKRSDVVDLLKSRGIDLDNNRFLILQGEVEQIAMMKPKAINSSEVGMLEYLEDIIGSNKYVEKIEATAKEVEALNEERTEKLNRVKLVEKERDGLEEAKQEAEEYLRLEAAIVDKRAIVYQIQRNQIDAKVEGARKEKEELENQLKQHRAKMESYAAQVESFEQQFNRENGEYERLGEELKNAKSNFENYEKKDVKLQEDIKHIKTKQKKLEKTLKQEKKTLDEKRAQQKIAADDIEKFRKEIDELTQRLQKEEKILEKMNEKLKVETGPFHVELDKKQKEYLPWQKKIDDVQSKINICQSEYNMLNERSKSANNELTKAKADLETMAQTLLDRQKEITALKKQIEDSGKKLAQAKKEMETLNGQDVKLAADIRELRTKEEELTSQLQASKSQNKVLNALMKEKTKGKFVGIYGRLGDLGTIDSKYDVAISTACKALDYIVVDSTTTGEQCINFLKQQNLGRTTFIVLEKVQHLAAKLNANLKIPENAERLIDLITVKDKKFLPAFYFGLQDTLVTNDLAMATKIAFGSNTRWRVVTLAGHLIDRSGTMSGGGTKTAKGGMKTQFAEDTEKLRANKDTIAKQLEEKSVQLKEVREKYESLEIESKELETTITKSQIELQKKEMDLKGISKQREELESRLPELEAQTQLKSTEVKRMKELEMEIKNFEKEIAKIKLSCGSLEAEIKSLEEKIANVGGIELKSQKAKVEGLTSQIDNATNAMTKLEVQIKSAEKTIKKAEKSIFDVEAELTQLEATLKKKLEERKDLEEETAKVLQNFKQIEKVYEAKQKELKKLQKEHDKITRELNALRSIEVDLVNKLEDINKILKENDAKQQEFVKKIATLNKKKASLKIDDTDEPKDVPILSPEELKKYSLNDLQAEIGALEEKIGKMKPNMTAIAEYRKKEELYRQRVAEMDEVTERRDMKRKEYEDLRKKRLEEFMAGFSEISLKLKEMYQMITLGGDAELELNDSLDPFSEGISFSVRPPKKSWKNISNLSGGEKTLSSLALVFALHHYKPTPIYIMDEIDAALDFKNVSIIANYIKERTKNAQFIIVSLRNFMFELADRLVGIYKTNNCTKSVTIDPKAFTVPVAETSLAQEANLDNGPSGNQPNTNGAEKGNAITVQSN